MSDPVVESCRRAAQRPALLLAYRDAAVALAEHLAPDDWQGKAGRLADDFRAAKAALDAQRGAK